MDVVTSQGPDSDEAANDQASNIHWLKLSEQYTTAGFREGIIAAKELSLQGGFDEGFKTGSPLGRRIGLMRGIISTFLTLSKSPSGSAQIRERLRKISVELDSFQDPERLAMAAREVFEFQNNSEQSHVDSLEIKRLQTELAEVSSQLEVEVSQLFDF